MFENSKYTAVNQKNFLALYSVIQKIYYPSKNFNPKVDLGRESYKKPAKWPKSA